MSESQRLRRQMNDDPEPIFGQLPHLSPRLRQTLKLMLTPMSLKEIAAELHLSRHTINDYQKSLYRLFGVNTRAALICLFHPANRSIRIPEPAGPIS
jgi:DNA-binding CsgD family transcriptional regulator